MSAQVLVASPASFYARCAGRLSAADESWLGEQRALEDVRRLTSSPKCWLRRAEYKNLASKPTRSLISLAKMSHLQYFDYPGFGERSKKELNYSQAVRIDNRIEVSGQGKCP
jgi:hypothetical protein